jgi:hypothetical protein
MGISLIGAAYIDDGVLRTNSGQGVDMRVGIIACEETVVEPVESGHSQVVGKRPLKLAFIQMRVAIRVKEALAGSQQCACAIGFNAAPFKYKPGNLQGGGAPNTTTSQARGYLIIQISSKFEAPTIETKIKEKRFLVLQDRYRAKIAGPGVIGWQRNQRDSRKVNACPKKLILYRPNFRGNENNCFKAADCPNNVKKDLLYFIKMVFPVCLGMGPGKQDPILGFPFGW